MKELLVDLTGQLRAINSDSGAWLAKAEERALAFRDKQNNRVQTRYQIFEYRPRYVLLFTSSSPAFPHRAKMFPAYPGEANRNVRRYLRRVAKVFSFSFAFLFKTLAEKPTVAPDPTYRPGLRALASHSVVGACEYVLIRAPSAASDRLFIAGAYIRSDGMCAAILTLAAIS